MPRAQNEKAAGFPAAFSFRTPNDGAMTSVLRRDMGTGGRPTGSQRTEGISRAKASIQRR